MADNTVDKDHKNAPNAKLANTTNEDNSDTSSEPSLTPAKAYAKGQLPKCG